MRGVKEGGAREGLSLAHLPRLQVPGKAQSTQRKSQSKKTPEKILQMKKSNHTVFL
jgi:hypothetical protein